MNVRSAVEYLIPAELAYAYFNACRTTEGDEAAIRLGKNADFEFIIDPTRPSSRYYNRAVCRHTTSLSAVGLASLPESVQSLEVLPKAVNDMAAYRAFAMGFRPAYSLCYLATRPTPGTTRVATVSRLMEDQSDDFLDLLQIEGVEFPREKRQRKRKYYCTDQFITFVARNPTGIPCAWATMYANAMTAFFGNTFTRPEYRNLGHHASLLAARLHYAREIGVQRVYTDVEHGTQSHHNCERAGFRIITINTIWAKIA